MTLRRRTFLHLAAGAVALPAVTRFAKAQTFPSKPVTLIVPWTPGGTTDVALRALATATERHLGRSRRRRHARACANGGFGEA
jgi:tripartite-type tricarboxylate transporter receptor subunit TctC